MDALNYKLEAFEGPLDLLLSLIHKNKMSIDDIQINIICEQYLSYIAEAQALDLELASEFIVMASELMLIKSKLLLPRVEEDEEDPRAALADALQKYQQAKEAAQKMAPLYARFSQRLEKDTDEISIDKTFVLDHEVEDLCLAVRRIITYNENRPKLDGEVFKPMISSPIVPVEVKITGILRRMSEKKATSLNELLSDSVSLPDMIAIFLGVLELIKIQRIFITSVTIIEDTIEYNETGLEMMFKLNPDFVPGEGMESEFDLPPSTEADESEDNND